MIFETVSPWCEGTKDIIKFKTLIDTFVNVRAAFPSDRQGRVPKFVLPSSWNIDLREGITIHVGMFYTARSRETVARVQAMKMVALMIQLLQLQLSINSS